MSADLQVLWVDTRTVIAEVAHDTPVKLGLREGLNIKVRYLLRATGVQGANDASTALAEAIDGSNLGMAGCSLFEE